HEGLLTYKMLLINDLHDLASWLPGAGFTIGANGDNIGRRRSDANAGSVSRETRGLREVPVCLLFHVKRVLLPTRRLMTSMTSDCRSLGETPGILPAWPRLVGRAASSFSRASKD